MSGMTTGLSDDEAAALWADLEVRPEFSARERGELDAWLAERPDRARLLQSHRRLIDDPVLEAALAPAARRARGRWADMAGGGGLALAAGLAAVVVLAGAQVPTLVAGEGLSTGRGEARREMLADGSEVHLNGATKARVRLRAQARQVRLMEGEAYFAVAHDPERPFSVRSPHAVITAVGTQFDVDRLGEATEVAVYEGRVRVEAAGGLAPPVYLGAGERARIEGGSVQRLTSFEPTQARDWRSGWLEVEDTPLGDLLTELNRASPTLISATGPDVLALSVSGRFSLADPEGAADMVAALHGLEARRQGGRIVLTPRAG